MEVDNKDMSDDTDPRSVKSSNAEFRNSETKRKKKAELSSHKVKIRKYLGKFKKSSKRLLFYLGMISLILFVSFSLLHSEKPSKEKSCLLLASLAVNSSQSPSKEPFLSSSNEESAGLLLIEKNSLQAAIPPSIISPQVLGSSLSQYPEEEEKKEEKVIREYIVEEGDTLSSLAEKFEISLETILWANDLNKKATIKPGQKLIILPVSGVIHHIKSEDTLSEIAQTYRADLEEIIGFNELANENDIYVEDILIIPNGVILPQVNKPQQKKQAVNKPQQEEQIVEDQPNIQPNVQLDNSLFILPVSSDYIITQGLHWYNAIDFSHPGYACGRPVFAAAGGTVQKISYDSAYGNYLTILHSNNVVTLYAHLSSVKVNIGDPVNVGDVIGYIGNTGHTEGHTGCHLHFEVRPETIKNPFAY